MVADQLILNNATMPPVPVLACSFRVSMSHRRNWQHVERQNNRPIGLAITGDRTLPPSLCENECRHASIACPCVCFEWYRSPGTVNILDLSKHAVGWCSNHRSTYVHTPTPHSILRFRPAPQTPDLHTSNLPLRGFFWVNLGRTTFIANTLLQQLYLSKLKAVSQCCIHN